MPDDSPNPSLDYFNPKGHSAAVGPARHSRLAWFSFALAFVHLLMGACIQLTAVWNSDSIQKMLYFAALLAVPPLNIVLAATALTRISKSRGRLLGVIASTVALVTSLLALLAIIAVMILGFYMMRNFNPG